MPEITHLNRVKPVTASIDMGDGDVVRITFDRNKLTSAWDESVRSSPGFAESLAEVILSWDVSENGQPLPPSAENIGRLSIPAQGTLYQRLVEASIPSSAEGNASTNTSPTPSEVSTSEPVSLPNGDQPSTLPQPSASLSTT